MKSSTENMKVDIDSIPEGMDASKEIGFLRNIRSWRNIEIEDVPAWNLHRYLVILYMHDSFLNKKNPLPLMDRKYAALEFARLKVNKDITKELFLLENDLILLMVRDLLIAQNNWLWSEIVTLEHQYEEAVRLRLKSNEDGSQAQATLKRSLTADCKMWQVDLAMNYKRFYFGHTDAQAKIRQKATTLESLAVPTDHYV